MTTLTHDKVFVSSLSSSVVMISSMIVDLFHNNKLEIDPRINMYDDNSTTNNFDYILTIPLPNPVTTTMQYFLRRGGAHMGQELEQEDVQVWKFGINFPIMIFWYQLAMVS